MQTAADYIREISDSITGTYPRDCVWHACRIAELLLAEGRAPWIGRVRDERSDIELGPLIPKRAPSLTWTTHYIACSEDEAYDPLAGETVSVGDLASRIFGRPLPVAVHLDVAETEHLLKSGEIRKAFPPFVRLRTE